MALRDEADWDGVIMVRTDVGNRNRHKCLRVDGVQYATEGEANMARLLLFLGIGFTPNVSIMLQFPDPPGATRPFVPDFVFNRLAFVWSGSGGKETLIHGIEVKGMPPCRPGSTKPPKKAVKWTRKKIQLLERQRRINILLLTDAEVTRYLRRGRLPIRAFMPEQR